MLRCVFSERESSGNRLNLAIRRLLRLLGSQRQPAVASAPLQVGTAVAQQARARIVYWANGGGLSQSSRIVATSLASAQWRVQLSHDHKWLTSTDIGILQGAHRLRRRVSHQLRALVTRLRFRLNPSARADLNIFLEDIVPADLPAARANIWIPNQEYPPGNWAEMASKIDMIWVKTRYAEKIFKEMNYPTTFVGFGSFDFYDQTIEKKPGTFLHVAGRSRMKGTDLLIMAWQRNPHWPLLTIIQSPLRRCSVMAKNIDYRAVKLPANKLRRLQNESEFHVYPSLAEGFGHVLSESMGMGGIVITTNAPPMNELVTRERGLLVDYDKMTRQGLGMNYHCSMQSLEDTIEQALQLSDDDKISLSRHARKFFLDSCADFQRRLTSAAAQML